MLLTEYGYRHDKQRMINSCFSHDTVFINSQAQQEKNRVE